MTNWDDYAKKLNDAQDRYLMEAEGAQARIFNMVEGLTDDQLEIFLRLTQSSDRIVWQLSGVLASERHKRSMRVPQ